MLILMVVIAIGIVFFYVLNEWAEGAYGGIDAAMMALFLSAFVFLSYFLVEKYNTIIGSLPIAAVAGYILYRRKFTNGRSILLQNADRYRRLVVGEPKNLAAREMLATALYDLGELDQALYEMRSAVSMGAGTNCQYKLNKWTLERKVLVDGIPVCRWCDTENKVGEKYCIKCGFELPYDSHITRRLFAGKKTSKLLGVIITITVIVVVFAVMIGISSTAYVPIFFGLVSYWGWQMVKGARS